MKRYESNPCAGCGHRATGDVLSENLKEGTSSVEWDPPPLGCDCRCHFAWRFLHGVPAAEAAA